jgi:hypothetical protein
MSAVPSVLILSTAVTDPRAANCTPALQDTDGICVLQQAIYSLWRCSRTSVDASQEPPADKQLFPAMQALCAKLSCRLHLDCRRVGCLQGLSKRGLGMAAAGSGSGSQAES